MGTALLRCISGPVNWGTFAPKTRVINTQTKKGLKSSRNVALKSFFTSSSQANESSDCLRPKENSCDGIPSKCDVCIIGGGIMGLSTAFWLKQHQAGKDMKIVVVEKDPNYTKASTVLSNGGVRQQFSLEENIKLSLYGADFIKRADEFLGIKGQSPIDVQYHPSGYLFLATTIEGAEILGDNWSSQTRLGAKVELLTRAKLKRKFPYLRVEDIELASHGLANEGWFDPWSLLNGFKRKAISLGATYVTGEVSDFNFKMWPGEPIAGPNQIIVKTPNEKVKVIEFNHCVIAAGYDSGKVASLAGIGKGKGFLSYSLPVEARKRYVYFSHAPYLTDPKFPTLIDPTGAYARPGGRSAHFLTGCSPTLDEEPQTENLDVDHDFFDTHVWPKLIHRIPHMEHLKVKSAWSGYYDYNTFDQNGIVGTHPAFKNMYFATGFSGHGIQQAPGVGRAIMELILYNKYLTINLDRFGFDRFIDGTRVLEQNII